MSNFQVVVMLLGIFSAPWLPLQLLKWYMDAKFEAADQHLEDKVEVLDIRLKAIENRLSRLEAKEEVHS
jgi:hypothetical protein